MSIFGPTRLDFWRVFGYTLFTTLPVSLSTRPGGTPGVQVTPTIELRGRLTQVCYNNTPRATVTSRLGLTPGRKAEAL